MLRSAFGLEISAIQPRSVSGALSDISASQLCVSELWEPAVKLDRSHLNAGRQLHVVLDEKIRLAGPVLFADRDMFDGVAETAGIVLLAETFSARLWGQRISDPSRAKQVWSAVSGTANKEAVIPRFSSICATHLVSSAMKGGPVQHIDALDEAKASARDLVQQYMDNRIPVAAAASRYGMFKAVPLQL